MARARRTPEQACEDAVALAGGPTAVAVHFDISPQAVCKWRVVPSDKCLELSRLIGYRVRVYEMDPNVFGETGKELRLALI